MIFWAELQERHTIELFLTAWLMKYIDLHERGNLKRSSLFFYSYKEQKKNPHKTSDVPLLSFHTNLSLSAKFIYERYYSESLNKVLPIHVIHINNISTMWALSWGNTIQTKMILKLYAKWNIYLAITINFNAVEFKMTWSVLGVVRCFSH